MTRYGSFYLHSAEFTAHFVSSVHEPLQFYSLVYSVSGTYHTGSGEEGTGGGRGTVAGVRLLVLLFVMAPFEPSAASWRLLLWNVLANVIAIVRAVSETLTCSL